MKDAMTKAAMNIAVVLMALAIPFGFGMALYTDDSSWFLLCAFLLIFLS